MASAQELCAHKYASHERTQHRGSYGISATSGIWVSKVDQQAQEGSLEHQGGKGFPLPPLASGCQEPTSRHRKAHLNTRGARGFPATSGSRDAAERSAGGAR